MRLRDGPFVVAFRLLALVAVVAGVVFAAAGPTTIAGMLPYFTLQSNVAYGGYLGWALWRARRADVATSTVATSAAVKGAVTLYIAITGLVFHLILDNNASGFAQPAVDRHGADAIGNQLQHTVVPVMAVLDWLLFDSRGRYRWRYALYWLAFPIGYLGFALLRGSVVHRYPYPFVDVTELGYRGVAVTALAFAVAFWALGLLFVAIDRGAARWTPRGSRGGVLADPVVDNAGRL